MKRTGFSAGAIALASLALASAPASAATINVSLGQSAEIFTLYGLGPLTAGSPYGTFAIGQGASTFDGVTTTFTLSGAITGGTAGYNSGTYQFITTYLGANTPLAGPNAPTGRTNANNLLAFNYRTIDPSTTMKLVLDLPSGTFETLLFANDNFVPGANWNFVRTSSTCTGINVCTQNNVGLTPGSTIYGPVVTSVTFTVPDAVPEPGTWAIMIGGFACVGTALRRRATTLRFA